MLFSLLSVCAKFASLDLAGSCSYYFEEPWGIVFAAQALNRVITWWTNFLYATRKVGMLSRHFEPQTKFVHCWFEAYRAGRPVCLENIICCDFVVRFPVCDHRHKKRFQVDKVAKKLANPIRLLRHLLTCWRIFLHVVSLLKGRPDAHWIFNSWFFGCVRRVVLLAWGSGEASVFDWRRSPSFEGMFASEMSVCRWIRIPHVSC